MKKDILTNLCAGVMVVLPSTGFAYAQEPTPLPTVQSINQRLLQQRNALRSVAFSVQESKIIPEVQSEPEKSTYTWAFDGKRVLKKRPTVSQLNLTLFDGKQEEDRLYMGRNERTRVLQASYSNKRIITTNAPSPLSGAYRIQNRWLYDIVATGDFKVSLGTPDEQFGKTYLLEGIGRDKAQYRFVLAPDYGWTCIRSFQAMRSPETKSVTMQNIVKINALQNVKGVWLPKSLETHRLYDNEYTTKMSPFEDATLEVRVDRLNDVPSKYFDLLPLSEGCTVVDTDAQRRYRFSKGKRVPEAGPLTSRDNFWRWGFTVAVATGVFGAVTFGLNRVPRAKTP